LKKNLIWSQLLDLLRYLIVWNPIIAISAQIIFYIFHVKTEKTLVHTGIDHRHIRNGHNHLNEAMIGDRHHVHFL